MVFPRKLAQGIVLTVALGLTGVLIVGIWRATQRGEEQSAPESGASDAEMKLTDMEYTEMQEGKRLWTLKASEAKYFQDEQKTVLSAVRLTLFLDSGEEVYLRSQEGVLFAGSKNIELTNDVQATLPQGYQLSTERAFYDHQKKKIFSETLIHVTGPDLKLQGNHWEYRIPEERGILEGGVRASVVFLPPATKPNQ